MNRDELLLYLKNLRNLETLKHCAIKQMELCDNSIAKANEKIKEKGYRFYTSTIISFIISIILIGLAIGSYCYSSTCSYSPFFCYCLKYMIPFMLLVFAVVIPSCCGAFSDLFQTLSLKKKAKQHNKYVNSIRTNILKEIEEIVNRKEEIKSETQEINKLLVEAYSFNLIPSQFRNLECIIYIYDYMATSQQPIENAFFHSHIEEAIKQITSRLDVIIEQNMEMLRLIRSNLLANSAMISQIETLSNDMKFNNHLISVNNYYLRSKIF